MRKSNNWESVRNDEIFKSHLGSGAGPWVSIHWLLQDTSHIHWFHPPKQLTRNHKEPRNVIQLPTNSILLSSGSSIATLSMLYTITEATASYLLMLQNIYQFKAKIAEKRLCTVFRNYFKRFYNSKFGKNRIKSFQFLLLFLIINI